MVGDGFRLFRCVLFYNQQKVIGIQLKVTLIVAVVVHGSLARGVLAGEVSKVEPFFYQFVAADFGFACGVQGKQDSPVFAQGMIDAAHVAGFIAVEAVVVGGATRIAAEFFVGPAGETVTAFQTGACFGFRHS